MQHRRFEIGLANNRCSRLRAESEAFLAIEMVVLPLTIGKQPIARSVAEVESQNSVDYYRASVERNGPIIALTAGRNITIGSCFVQWIGFEVTEPLRVYPLQSIHLKDFTSMKCQYSQSNRESPPRRDSWLV
jgi:hypothetical protein